MFMSDGVLPAVVSTIEKRFGLSSKQSVKMDFFLKLYGPLGFKIREILYLRVLYFHRMIFHSVYL